jgi:hypothetical protein
VRPVFGGTGGMGWALIGDNSAYVTSGAGNRLDWPSKGRLLLAIAVVLEGRGCEVRRACNGGNKERWLPPAVARSG